jgi:hypothetical protein
MLFDMHLLLSIQGFLYWDHNIKKLLLSFLSKIIPTVIFILIMIQYTSIDRNLIFFLPLIQFLFSKNNLSPLLFLHFTFN